MTEHCYLADLATARLGGSVTVGGDEGRHAAVVKRTRLGEVVLLTDGRGQAIRGPVIEVGKQSISVQVAELLSAAPGRHRWTAVQALAKGDRSDIAVESLTELGAARIVAWQAARSVVRWDAKAAKGITKWQATARESTKQSRRFIVPEVSYATTREVIELVRAADLVLVCHEQAITPLAHVQLPEAGEVVLIVGPEGGISAEELAGFETAGAKLVSLGDGVLRTSSAGVVALAQLQVLANLPG